MISSVTPEEYTKAYEEMKEFIEASGKTGLMTWLKWWDNRRTHIVEAYRPLYKTPNVNLAESSHASMEHCGGTNLSLVDATYYDMSESLRLAQIIHAYEEGPVKPGSGPSAAELEQREYQKEKRRTDSYIKNLETSIKSSQTLMLNTDPRPTENANFQINGRSSHRPTKGIPDNLAKRPTRTRTTASNNFKKSLELAKGMKGFYKIVNVVNISPTQGEVILKSPEGNLYHINICQHPKCSCPFFESSTGKLCKHQVFIFMECCNVQETNKLIWQVAFSIEETRQMIRQLRAYSHSIPCSTTTAHEACLEAGDKDVNQWLLTTLPKQGGRAPSCLGCRKKTFKTGDIHIVKKGLYRLENKGIVERKFWLCANGFCIGVKPQGSNLVMPPDAVYVDQSAVSSISKKEIAEIKRSGVKVM